MSASLRFAVDTRVECNNTGKWEPGTVIGHFYEEPSFGPNEVPDLAISDRVAPYQIKLDDGLLIYAPIDDDCVIRALAPPSKEIQRAMPLAPSCVAGLNATAAHAADLVAMGPSSKPSVPKPAAVHCYTRVHGRKEQSSFEMWVRTIKVENGHRVAVVLDGSESMSLARAELLRVHGKKNPQLSMLHAHLHDEKIEPPTDGLPFVLLTTEAFYKRDLGITFDAVYDDCQVHRVAIEKVPSFGLMATLKTFVISQRELESRQQKARKNASKWGTFIPRAPSVAGCVDGEPADLAARNDELCKDVRHPMLRFPLAKPKFSWSNGLLRYEPERNRTDPLDINALPLANLLFDAADAEALAPSQRLALVATVCASQVTSNLPRIFESVSRATFSGRKEGGGAGAKATVTPHEKKRAREVALSVLVRGFLSGCGRSTDEIGLALHFLTTRYSDIPGVAINLEGAPLSSYYDDEAARAALRQAEKVRVTLLDTMAQLLVTTLAELERWCLSSAAKARIATVRAAYADAPDCSAWPAEDAFFLLKDAKAFLEGAVLSAARRGQPGCSASVLDVGLVPKDVAGELRHAREYFGQLDVPGFGRLTGADQQSLELEVVRQALQRKELDDAWVEYQLVVKGQPLTLKSKAAADYYDDDFDDFDPFEDFGYYDGYGGFCGGYRPRRRRTKRERLRAEGDSEVALASSPLWLCGAAQGAFHAANAALEDARKEATARWAKEREATEKEIAKLNERVDELEDKVAKLKTEGTWLEQQRRRGKIEATESFIGQLLDKVEMLEDLVEMRPEPKVVVERSFAGRVVCLRRRAIYDVSRVIVVQGALWVDAGVEEAPSEYDARVSSVPTLPPGVNAPHGAKGGDGKGSGSRGGKGGGGGGGGGKGGGRGNGRGANDHARGDNAPASGGAQPGKRHGGRGRGQGDSKGGGGGGGKSKGGGKGKGKGGGGKGAAAAARPS